MSIRHLPAITATVLCGGIAVAAPASASVQQTAAVTGMTSGRIGPSLTALVGLAGVALGGFALTRLRHSNANPRKSAVAALISGLTSLVVGTVLAATAAGGPGTGHGIVGSWAAMALGATALILGGLALNRLRHVTRVG